MTAMRLLLLASLLAVAGCGATRVAPATTLPAPLVEKLPASVGIHYTTEFRGYVHKEKRYGSDYEVTLGGAHVANLDRLLAAMFTRVVHLDSPAAIATVQPPLEFALVPRFEEYSFVTPRDVAGGNFAVTIAYRLDVYDPTGRQVDSLRFSGFGTSLPGTMGASTAAIIRATQLAMRDAGAKFAVELPEQESIRRLMLHETVEPMPTEAEEAAAAAGTFEAPPAAPPVPASPAAATPAAAPAAPTEVPPSPTAVPPATPTPLPSPELTPPPIPESPPPPR